MLHFFHILFRVGVGIYGLLILLDVVGLGMAKRKEKRENLCNQRPTEYGHDHAKGAEKSPRLLNDRLDYVEWILELLIGLLIIIGAGFFEVFCG